MPRKSSPETVPTAPPTEPAEAVPATVAVLDLTFADESPPAVEATPPAVETAPPAQAAPPEGWQLSPYLAAPFHLAKLEQGWRLELALDSVREPDPSSLRAQILEVVHAQLRARLAEMPAPHARFHRLDAEVLSANRRERLAQADLLRTLAEREALELEALPGLAAKLIALDSRADSLRTEIAEASALGRRVFGLRQDALFDLDSEVSAPTADLLAVATDRIRERCGQVEAEVVARLAGDGLLDELALLRTFLRGPPSAHDASVSVQSLICQTVPDTTESPAPSAESVPTEPSVA